MCYHLLQLLRGIKIGRRIIRGSWIEERKPSFYERSLKPAACPCEVARSLKPRLWIDEFLELSDRKLKRNLARGVFQGWRWLHILSTAARDGIWSAGARYLSDLCGCKPLWIPPIDSVKPQLARIYYQKISLCCKRNVSYVCRPGHKNPRLFLRMSLLQCLNLTMRVLCSCQWPLCVSAKPHYLSSKFFFEGSMIQI